MIFVTIGTQEPFDRLIKAMDEVALLLKDTEIVAQAFKTDHEIKNMKILKFLSPKEFEKYFNEAQLVVSHAGMGTIISALVQNKPIVVMPRLMKYHEHRNEHQLATAKRFDDLNYVRVAYDEEQLKSTVLELYAGALKPLHTIGTTASENLVGSIKSFIR